MPQASIEFEVASPKAVAAAAEELQSEGCELLHGAREEPWGQTVARMLSREGASLDPYTPALVTDREARNGPAPDDQKTCVLEIAVTEAAPGSGQPRGFCSSPTQPRARRFYFG